LVAYGSYKAFKWLAKVLSSHQSAEVVLVAFVVFALLVLVEWLLLPVSKSSDKLYRRKAAISLRLREHRFELGLGARERQRSATEDSNTKLP
jgi:hypothetical protein